MTTGLTLNPLYFLNGIIHLAFLELSIIIFRDIKDKTRSWSANILEPGQTAQMYRAWSDCMDVQPVLALYWWQRLITFSSIRIRVKDLDFGLI